MKKGIKILLIILITIGLITGGLLMKLGTPFDIFLTKDFTKPTVYTKSIMFKVKANDNINNILN